jgi:hypothetical protein
MKGAGKVRISQLARRWQMPDYLAFSYALSLARPQNVAGGANEGREYRSAAQSIARTVVPYRPLPVGEASTPARVSDRS